LLSSCPTRARQHRPPAWVFLLFHVTRGSHQTPALARYRSCSITHFYIHHHTHLTFCNRHVPMPMPTPHRCARWTRTRADGAWAKQILAIPISVTRTYCPLMITSAGRQNTMNENDDENGSCLYFISALGACVSIGAIGVITYCDTLIVTWLALGNRESGESCNDFFESKKGEISFRFATDLRRGKVSALVRSIFVEAFCSPEGGRRTIGQIHVRLPFRPMNYGFYCLYQTTGYSAPHPFPLQDLFRTFSR
jgi:hypothetical protein